MGEIVDPIVVNDVFGCLYFDHGFLFDHGFFFDRVVFMFFLKYTCMMTARIIPAARNL